MHREQNKARRMLDERMKIANLEVKGSTVSLTPRPPYFGIEGIFKRRLCPLINFYNNSETSEMASGVLQLHILYLGAVEE